MSIIDLAGGVGDAQEPVIAPADEEYKLRVVAVKVDTDKNDNGYMLPTFEVVDNPLVKEFTRFFSTPRDDMDEKKLNSCKLQLKRFFDAVGFEPGPNFDTEQLIGLKFWAILGVEEDEKYGASNYIKKFIAA